MQTGERTTSKALLALALASLLTAPAWSQDASGRFVANPYQELYGQSYATPRADAANPYSSGESFGPADSRGGENYGINPRNGPADPYLSLYRYGTAKPDGLGERYAPSQLYSAPADPDLSMYRYGTRSPDGLSHRYRSGELSPDPYDLGTTSDDDLMNAGLSSAGKSREGSDLSEGDDESGLAYPYPPLLSASPPGSVDGLSATPSASDDGGASDANSAWVSAPTETAGDPLALKNPTSAGRAPKFKRSGKPADPFGELNAPKDAIDGPLGFDPHKPKSIYGDNPASSARKATAADGPIPAAPPSSGGLASPLPALPSSVGPSSVGPSVPGGPSP